jgi:glycosyltransferase involved in cell wall biosynthesis
MKGISVIIPTKNRSHLLKMTLLNILGQSLKPQEIIVVDDGSTDGTKEMIGNEFATSVIFLSNQGKGPGAARNTGFSRSRGEFIQFFDSDDLMTSNKLQVQSALLCADDKTDLVYGPYVMVEQEGNDWRQLDVIMQFNNLPSRPLHYLVAEGWCAITQSCMFRRSVIEKAGPWREDLMPHEDKEYWYRLGKTIRYAVHENQSCVFYRQHRNQITDLHVKELERTRDAIKAFDMIIRQMKNDGSPLTPHLICRGIRAGYVKYLNDHNQNDLKNTFVDKTLYSFYRILQKFGRIITGTNWQPFHGALASRDKFNEYKLMVPVDALK